MRTAGRRALVVGAVTRDLEVGSPTAPARPGGVVTFAGLAYARLGFAVRIVTRLCTADAPALLEPLRRAGADIVALPSGRTTTYRNDYRDGADTHLLLATSDPIAPGDVPADWLAEAHVVHAGPLHRFDVVPEAVGGAGGLVGVDVQGLVREPADPTLVQNLLGRWARVARVVQASDADVPALFGGLEPAAACRRLGVPELVVTRGRRGLEIFGGGRTVRVPALRVVRGETRGAGDTLLAVYLAARALGWEPARAGKRAAEVTAIRIERGAVPRGALD